MILRFIIRLINKSKLKIFVVNVDDFYILKNNDNCFSICHKDHEKPVALWHSSEDDRKIKEYHSLQRLFGTFLLDKMRIFMIRDIERREKKCQ